MIKGALIFAAGLTLGYAKALQESDEVVNRIDAGLQKIMDRLKEPTPETTTAESQGETPS